ncbi:hypothetical protein PINS_up003801 [Pythium insidiosum]|nr:hypothetical protein PINS_up003801 [Pythium insidiosum]
MGDDVVSLAELWAFVERVATASPDQLAEAQATAVQLLSRRVPPASLGIEAPPLVDPPVDDATSDPTLLCEEANERVARRVLERAASSLSSIAGSEDKSDTMSDCTTTTETSSVYGLQNTWVDLAMLYSLPFVAADGPSAPGAAAAAAPGAARLKAVPPLNVAQEQSNLQRVFQDSQRAVHTMRAVATIDSLRKVLDRGVTVLHFSGHGGRVAGKKNCLVFEDTQRTGLAHFIDAPTLRAIISDGIATPSAPAEQLDSSHLARHDAMPLDGDESGGAPSTTPSFAVTRSVSSFSSFSRIGLSGTLKLVFVSSCHSREVGEVFVQAGVQHVVCVRSGDKILDDASAHFSASFYHALLAGKTIHQAFDTARVRVAADLQIPENEGNKFVLLESSQVHADSCSLSSPDDAPHVIEVNTATLEQCSCHAANAQFVFADISGGKSVDVSPTNRFAKTLPAIPESFVGREHELHMVAGLTTSQRFVTLRGPPGIGKSTLSIRLAHFLAERNVFPDGVAFIRLRGVQSLEGVETAIKSALYPDGGREKETPLHLLLADQKVLLVMDNMEDPINANPAATREFLVHLLQNTPNLALLMTARQALGGGIAGFDEKVVSLNRLSHYHASDLFLRKSPRGLLLSEIGDIETKQPGKSRANSVLEALASHPLMAFLDGHPQAISLCAALLQDRSLSELTRTVLSRGVGELQVVGLAATDRSAMNTLVTSLDVSLEQVRQQYGADAIRFFSLLGLLPAGAMPADFKSLWGPKWESLVETLQRFSLLQRNRIPGFVLSNSRGLPKQSNSSSSRRSSSRSSSRHGNNYDHAMLSALKAYGDFISGKAPINGKGIHETSDEGVTAPRSEKNLLNTFTRSGRASRVAEHVEKMDSQAEIMAVCVSYSTFPFITSYARGLLGLYDDDGAKNRTLESICAADRDLFVYNTARHFWKVSHWVFQHICTLAARSSASYLILDMHESNMWMLLDLHIRMLEDWRKDGSEAWTSRSSELNEAHPRDHNVTGSPTPDASAAPWSSMRKVSSIVVDVACFFAHSLFLSGRHRGAWNAANKALHIAKVHKDTLSEANARKLMGVLLTTETKFDEAKAQFGMALILYKAVGDKIGQAASLSAIGMIHSRKGNLRGAHNCFTKALTLYEWFKHALGQLNCHQRLANLEKKLRDGDGLRGKNGQSTGHSHHYAATRRLQGDLNRRRNGEYIVRWVGHEMSLLLELPAASNEKIQEVHAPSDASLTARGVSAIDTENSTIGATSESNVTNTPKKSRLEQIIDQREKDRGNPPPLALGPPQLTGEALPERLKNSSFVRRKEYDATIRRTMSSDAATSA